MKNAWRNVTLVALVAFGLAGCAAGMDSRPVAAAMAPAPAPEYRVGDEFTFKVAVLEDTQRVTAVDGNTATFDSKVFGTLKQPKAFSNPASWTGSGYALAQSVTLSSDMSSLFPLQVGKSVRGTGTGNFGGTQRQVAAQCDVVTSVNVEVPAGRFDTYMVECTFVLDANLANVRYVYWYAPSVGYWVAVNRNGSIHQLLSYKRA
jgi:hypothetical protein